MDALGKFNEHESPGLYQCHGGGGNQEWIFSNKTGHIKHAGSNYCLGLDESARLQHLSCFKVFFLF